MTTQPILESNMTFGPYPEGQCFHIEKSEQYEAIKDKVKIAEFILRKDKDFWIIEAKSSSPRTDTKPNFNDFISEVLVKFTNTFLLGLAIYLKRHEHNETQLNSFFQNVNSSETKIKFILVINGHEKEWLPPIQDALLKALSPLIKIWALPPNCVVVMNNELAKKHNLIFT
jgi:hypothetical protein